MGRRDLTREEEQRVYEVKSYIHNHLDKSFSVRQLALKAILGEQKFRDGFYRIFERTVGAYIHEAKMQLGKFLLQHSDKSIKEIALSCGYSRARNFSSAYKNFFGERPSAERVRSLEATNSATTAGPFMVRD